jgi:hypothetical protein
MGEKMVMMSEWNCGRFIHVQNIYLICRFAMRTMKRTFQISASVLIIWIAYNELCQAITSQSRKKRREKEKL